MPPYASFAEANQSSNGTSPICRDSRDDLIKEYGNNAVGDSYFAPIFGIPANSPKLPRFTPNCVELTQSANSAFQQINNPGPNATGPNGKGKPEFGWALIANE